MPSDPTLGQIMPVSFNQTGNLPKGFRLCDGSTLPIAQNQALFSLIGTSFGGNGTTTFGLPDLRGRAIVGQLNGVGMVSGTTTVTLTDQQMPSHNHLWAASTTPGGGRGNPSNNLFGVNTSGAPTQVFAPAGSRELSTTSGTNISTTGGNAAHNNVQPSLAINYMIAVAGVFPSRL